MNLHKKIIATVFGLVCFLLMFPNVSSAAAAQVSVSTLEEMKPYIVTAMEELQTSYTITYTGNSMITSTQWNTTFDSILKSEGNDYISNILKTRKIAQSGVAKDFTVTFTFTYWETPEQAAAVDTKVTSVLSSLNVDDMNDYEKEKAIHDWIVSNVIYDTSYTNHSAYSAITAPYKTVCQGYALLAYKMFTKAGLQARIITGTGSGVAHAWNLVKVDGNWYQIDLTWDDPITKSGEPDTIHYDYYNLTDKEMGVDHKWTGTYTEAKTEFSDTLNSKITSDASNATLYQGLINDLGLKYLADANTCSSPVDIQVKLQSAIAANKTEIDFRYLGKTILSSDLKAAATALGYITSYKYTTSPYPRTSFDNDTIVDVTFVSKTPVKATAVELSKDTMGLMLGGSQATLTATVAPANASTKTVIWSTSNAEVATVKNGVVKAVGGGTATITATTVDGGFTDSCTVTVTAAIKSVTLDQSKLDLTVGGSVVTLTPTLTPTSATVKDVIWKSSNPNVVTATGGAITAFNPGRAVVTVETVDGSKKATCTVNVYAAPKGVSLTSKLTMLIGKTMSLKATVTPSTAYKSVDWSSSDATVVKVSSTGVITALKDGTAIITATTVDGEYGKQKAVCEITVIRGVTKVTLNKDSLTLLTGDDNNSLIATVAPTDATIKTVTFTSSNTKVATVDADGTVHAIAPGKATITAASTQDATKSAKCTVNVYSPITEIKLSASELTLKLGKTSALSATITPSTANKGVTWTSSNEAIAKVSAAGVITPVATGSAIIKAQSADASLSATCNVTVVRGVTGVSLDQTTLTLEVGGSDKTLVAKIAPDDASDKTVTYTSSNIGIVTVDSNGKVHAVAPGRATITATSKQDATKVARCNVTVYSTVAGISLNYDTLTLNMDKRITLIATVTPSTARRDVTWKSDKESVVTVSSTGMLTPVGVGTAVITVTSSDPDIKDTCSVSVVYGVKGIMLNKSSLSMKIGDAEKLSSTITPAQADQTVSYSSSNESIVKVDSNGTVHAVAAGRAVITAISTQDNTKSVKCNVTVYSPVSEVTLSMGEYTLKLGKILSLAATVTPSTALKDVTWSSSNETVARVNAFGSVTPVGTGTATITVTTVDGAKTAECIVTVIQPITSISLDKTNLALQVGGSDQMLAVTIAPLNATIKDITWTSSNTSVATVGTNGTVHAVAPGTSMITATSVQDSTKYVRCYVTVTAIQ